MYLERFQIKRFRSIKELDLKLNKGLNIFIGENNSGKSAIIDALRICLGHGKQWRDIVIRNDEDFFIDISEIKDDYEPIEFDLYFAIESPEDRHIFNDLISQNPSNPDQQSIQIHFRYKLEKNPKGNLVLRWNIWGGDLDGQTIVSEELQELFYSYLAPLRDAEQALRPYVRDNKVTSLFKELTKYVKINEGEEENVKLDQNKKDELAQKLEDVIQENDWTGLISTGEGFINEHLEKADISKKGSEINLRLLEYKYDNIIKGILTRKPVYTDELIEGNQTKQKYFDINQNGLGENNLVYASAVLGDLENRRNEKIEHYYALLIEEPEAHLHPQKQNTFFNYLNSLQDLGVQLFITSHSPTITAKSDLDNINVLHKIGNEVKSIALNTTTLDYENKEYLRRFLDVTKSQLFFANGVIMVEGISEALLFPVFSEILNKSYNLDKNGIEIVNVNGVAFEPFAKLFNSDGSGTKLSTKGVIISDGDEHRNDGNKSNRAQKLENLKGENLDIQIAFWTFEYELMVASKYNADIMLELYQELHPRTTFKTGENLKERATELIAKLDLNKDKAVFSQKLSYLLSTKEQYRESFVLPEYIQNAIKWVIE